MKISKITRLVTRSHYILNTFELLVSLCTITTIYIITIIFIIYSVTCDRVRSYWY